MNAPVHLENLVYHFYFVSCVVVCDPMLHCLTSSDKKFKLVALGNKIPRISRNAQIFPERRN